MNIIFNNDVVPFYLIEDVFPKTLADKLFSELVIKKDEFQDARVQHYNQINKDFRSNTVLYLDNINNRKDSTILSTFDDLLINNNRIRSSLLSGIYPFNQILHTERHETQISRYGNEKQKLGWHVDGSDNKRIITLVYYFNNEKKWKGGDIQLTNSPLLLDRLLFDNPKTIKVTPKPNSLLMFSAFTSHRVLETSSSDVFEDGRFSANIWLS